MVHKEQVLRTVANVLTLKIYSHTMFKNTQ